MLIDKPVALTLIPQHLDVVLRALEELPFKVARPVFAEIERQILAQVKDEPTADQPASG